MLITLGRNEENGKYATVVENIDGKVYLVFYKQKNGSSDFKKVVTRLELNDATVNGIVEYYNRLK